MPGACGASLGCAGKRSTRVGQHLNLHPLPLGHPRVMPGVGALAEGCEGGTVAITAAPGLPRGEGLNPGEETGGTHKCICSFFTLILGNVLVVPSTPGPPWQHPGALGTPKAVQWSRYLEPMSFLLPFLMWSQSWSCMFSREASAFRLQGLPRQLDGAGQPRVLHQDSQGLWGH